MCGLIVSYLRPPCGLSQTNLNATNNGFPLYKNEVPRAIEFAVKYGS